MNEFEEKQYLAFRKNKGRIASIRNPYNTELEKGTKVYVYDVHENQLCKVLKMDANDSVSKGNTYYARYDELNFLDKEYSGTGLIKKGLRNERKDKYKGEYVIELLNDGKTIQLSQALLSLLQTNVNNYIGFAYDPEVKIFYIYASKSENDGYLLNEKNGRIISISDYRELCQIMKSNYIKVDFTPILDLENYPDLLFYTLYKEKNNNYTDQKSLTNSYKNINYFEESIYSIKNYPVGLEKSYTTNGVIGTTSQINIEQE